MQLTWDEVQEVLDRAQSMHPEEFDRHISNFVAPGLMGELSDDYMSITMGRNDQITVEQAASITAIFLSAFQLGWLVAERAFRNESA